MSIGYDQLFPRKIQSHSQTFATTDWIPEFFDKAIFPGRAFTRRMYAKFGTILDGKNTKWKKYYHARLDGEFKFDCEIWKIFLASPCENFACRPMVDVHKVNSAREICFYTDSSGNADLGFGGIHNKEWFFGKWGSFVRLNNPSIAYLELFALTTGILLWSHQLKNQRIVVFCDNQSVVEMVNQTTSICPNCMYLMRLLVLSGLIHDRRVYAKYVKSSENEMADSLSRLDFACFQSLAEKHRMDKYPRQLPRELWPIEKVWQCFK